MIEDVNLNFVDQFLPMIRFYFILIVLISYIECRAGHAGIGQDVQEIVEDLSEEYAVVVTNTLDNSIYLKCASADDPINGDGADDNDWWTLESGEALGWGFKMNFHSTTCFWCYVNNNGADARDSGNWYIHQNVWGYSSSGCGGAPGENAGKDDNGITQWEVREDGFYSNMCVDCDGGNEFDLYSEWGPEP